VQAAVVRSVRGSKSSAGISATPIPDSPLIRVNSTSDDPGTAVRVANAAAQALISYARSTTQTGATAALAARFRAAALLYQQRLDTVKRLQRTYGPNPSTSARQRINSAQADAQSALLTREGLRARYQTSQQTASSSPPLQSFSAARGTTSDRVRVTELLALLGLLAGAALGAALATARLNRRVARLTRP
jgi:hypothetical protein